MKLLYHALIFINICSVLLVTGCSGGGHTENPVAQTVTPTQVRQTAFPNTIEDLSVPLETLTLKRLQEVWRPNLTQIEMRQVFGEETYTDDFMDMDGQLIKLERDEYGGSNGHLTVYWTKEGQLVQAVFTDNDPSGRKRTYYPAIGQGKASSSEDNVLALKNAITPGEPVTLFGDTNAYEWWGGISPHVTALLDRNKKYKAISMSDDFVQIQEDSMGFTTWVPVWYLTEAAGQMKPIAPLALRVSGTVYAKWYPDSLQSAVELQDGDIVYAYRQYLDWYGIAISKHSQSSRQPGLVWVKSEQVKLQGSAPVWDGRTLDNSTSNVVSAVVRSELRLGMSKDRMRELFGDPQFTEASDNMNVNIVPVHTQTVWRYENLNWQILITWDDEGKLIRCQFRDAEDRSNFGMLNELGPFVPSQPVNWDWRYKSDLPYNFLAGRIEDTVLVAGEDGGFSGMHQDSDLYALKADTGKLIWQFDFGHDSHMFGLSTDHKRIAFLKQEGDRKYSLQALETVSGRKIWQKPFSFESNLWTFSFVVAGDVAVVSYQFGTDAESEKQSYMEGWSVRDGSHLWKIKLTANSTVESQYGNIPAIMVQTGTDVLLGGSVTAYNPVSGKALWKKNGRLAGKQAIVDDFPMTEQRRSFWTQDLDQLIKVDALTGNQQLKLPIAPNIRYKTINGRLIIKQESVGGNNIIYDNDVAKTSLIDLTTGNIVWALDGSAESEIVIGEVLYFTLNGKVMAYDLKNNRFVWNSALKGSAPFVLEYSNRLWAGSTTYGIVYEMDAASGKPLSRLLDVRIGYYDFTPEEQLKGYLTVIKDGAYIGSSNGYFSRMRK